MSSPPLPPSWDWLQGGRLMGNSMVVWLRPCFSGQGFSLSSLPRWREVKSLEKSYLKCIVFSDIRLFGPGNVWTNLFPREAQHGSNGKESACNARDKGDAGLIPESGRYLRGGHGNPLQYSCLENPMDRGAWQATIHGVAKSQTWLRMQTDSLLRCSLRLSGVCC